MPLTQLADEVLHLSERHALTPVLVTPSYLSLRRQFFIELVGTLARKTDRSIRLQWYRSMSGVFSPIGFRVARAQAAAINRSLAIRLATIDTDGTRTAVIELTASISRPGGVHRDLVIGYCDQRLEIPIWTAPIRLGGSPEEFDALQSAAA